MRVTQVRNWLAVLGAVLLMLPASTLAGPAGVTVTVETDRDSYAIGSLSTSPILVKIYAENNTDEPLVLTEAFWKPSAYAEFGKLMVYKELRPGEIWTGTSPQADKQLAFLPAPLALRAYQNVATETKLTYVTKTVNGSSVKLLGTFIGPHGRKLVARAEVYLNDFAASPVPDAFLVRVIVHPRSIWNWRTQEEATSGGEGYEAMALIKLR